MDNKNLEPSITCPDCGFRIKFSSSEILNNQSFVCPGCGKAMTLDMTESAARLKKIKIPNSN